MTPLRRVLAEKRLACMAVGILLLADLLLYGLAVRPARRGVEQTRQRLEQATLDAAARAADVETAQSRLAAARRADEQLGRFRADVLPRDLAQARALTYPRLAALAERFGLGLERRTSEHDQQPDARLDRLRTTLRLAGSYADIRGFLEAVESGRDFLIIDAIALSRRATEPGERIVVTLGVTTWFPAADQAAAARGAPADTVEGALPELRLAALAAPRPQRAAAGRNPFRFGGGAGALAAGGGEAAEPAPQRLEGGLPGEPAPTVGGGGGPRLRFIARVDAPRGAGLIAVLSDGETVFQGRVGDTIDGRFRIMRIGSDTAELEFLPSGERQVLHLDGT